MRTAFVLVAAAASVAATSSVEGKMLPAPRSLPQRCVSAEAVIVGAVASIEKDAVEIETAPGAHKISYKVALVKVESPLIGATGLTHVKVGFIPLPPQPAPAIVPNPAGGPVLIRRPFRGGGSLTPELKEGQQWALFLNKHPTAGFYIMAPMSPPIDVKSEEGKAQVEVVKRIAAVLADPMKALQAGKAEERFFASTVMVAKHRTFPATGGQVEQKPIPADESKLILKGMLESEWKNFDPRSGTSGVQALLALGLTPRDGWKQPIFKPGNDSNTIYKKAFADWLAGPGKDYQVKQYVPKPK